MRLRLLKTSTLTFTRPAGQAEYDENYNLIPSVPTTIPAQGSLQPWSKGEMQIEVPAGVRVKDVRLFYTKTKLQTADEQLGKDPDTTTIDGIEYEVYDQADWNQYGLSVDHYCAVLIRRDWNL